MKLLPTVAAAVLSLCLAGCGKHDPVVGKWQQTEAEHGWEVEFFDDGALFLHGEGAEQQHDHLNGKWLRTAAGLQFTGTWEHAGTAVDWPGTLQDEVLVITTDPKQPARRFRRS